MHIRILSFLLRTNNIEMLYVDEEGRAQNLANSESRCDLTSHQAKIYDITNSGKGAGGDHASRYDAWSPVQQTSQAIQKYLPTHWQ